MTQQLYDNWDEAKNAFEEVDDDERDTLEKKSCAERNEIRLFEELMHAIENETCVDEWNGPIMPSDLIERMSPYKKNKSLPQTVTQ